MIKDRVGGGDTPPSLSSTPPSSLVGDSKLDQPSPRSPGNKDDKPSSSSSSNKEMSLSFLEERFDSHGGNLDVVQRPDVIEWRMKERMKTISVALVLCLNIGVDPPDIIKTSPCARMECWIEPFTPTTKALDSIGKALQQQYERWQPRARYKQSLDPTVDEVKTLCLSLRRSAKNERVLFHYNGHGVPRPTNNGEVWVFNKSYTQYIPLSLYELQTWMGSPSIYVFDCSAAGLVVKWFNRFIDQREKELEKREASKTTKGRRSSTSSSLNAASKHLRDYILLAACASNELLPTNPDLPADVFTACLTTPIKLALQWACKHSVVRGVTPDMIERIPGRLNDRRTALGELNWIFTAVTDTIAWNVLPSELFQKLFRQDLLVASLFRNYLLAERIMRSANCTPLSWPELPPTHTHPMWNAWDLAADFCLAQLPELAANPSYSFKQHTFFTEQLTAFEVWLEFGSEHKRAPEQLPIVLQVLLSQTHRHRSLVLLGRFLNIGPWAVNKALSVGIFPYVLKLLQSPAVELRSVLVFIWVKILALDRSCQADLVKSSGHNYFIAVLANPKREHQERTFAAFVLASICCGYRAGQTACLKADLLPICLGQLTASDPELRKWGILCLGKLWEDYNEAKWYAIRERAHEKLCCLLTDPIPEIRAAAVYSIGTFLGGADESEQRKSIELNLGVTLPVVTADMSPMVRKETCIALARLIHSYVDHFKEIALEERKGLKGSSSGKARKNNSRRKGLSAEKDGAMAGTGGGSPPMSPGESTVYGCLWKMMLTLEDDPVEDVAAIGRAAVAYVHHQLEGVTNGGGSSSRRSGRASGNESPQRIGPSTSSGGSGIFRSLSGTMGIGYLRGSGSSDGSSRRMGSGSLDGPGGRKRKVPPPATREQLDRLEATGEVTSSHFEWCASSFSRPTEDGPVDRTAPVYIQRHWRARRNAEYASEARRLCDKRKKWNNDQIAILHGEAQAVALAKFHPYESILVGIHNKRDVTVWNWYESSQSKMNVFSNGNPARTRITAVDYINANDEALLLTGASDGVVRIWSHFADRSRTKLLTAWKALPEISGASRSHAGLVLAWQQDPGVLMTSGDVGHIRVWDVQTELVAQGIPSGTDSCVTALSTPLGAEQLLVVGTGNGQVRVFDRRIHGSYSCVAAYKEHKEWVLGTQITATGRILSGTTAGKVKFWDLRAAEAVKTLGSGTSKMSAFSAHRFSPMFATGSRGQKVRVHNHQGQEISQIRYHVGFLGQRIGAVSSLEFHPYKLFLAAGALDSIISVYTSRS